MKVVTPHTKSCFHLDYDHYNKDLGWKWCFLHKKYVLQQFWSIFGAIFKIFQRNLLSCTFSAGIALGSLKSLKIMKYADFMQFQDVQLFLKKFSFYDAKTKIWLVGTLEHGLPRLWRDSWTSPMIFRTIFNPTKIHWVSHFFLQNRSKSLKIAQNHEIYEISRCSTFSQKVFILRC